LASYAYGATTWTKHYTSTSLSAGFAGAHRLAHLYRDDLLRPHLHPDRPCLDKLDNRRRENLP
jgi:hypothetical protein